MEALQIPNNQIIINIDGEFKCLYYCGIPIFCPQIFRTSQLFEASFCSIWGEKGTFMRAKSTPKLVSLFLTRSGCKVIPEIYKSAAALVTCHCFIIVAVIVFN